MVATALAAGCDLLPREPVVCAVVQVIDHDILTEDQIDRMGLGFAQFRHVSTMRSELIS